MYEVQQGISALILKRWGTSLLGSKLTASVATEMGHLGVLVRR
jgi:hypothetical protein